MKREQNHMRPALVLLAGFLLAAGSGMAPAQAAVETRTVEYRQGDTVLEGYLAQDTALSALRPAVIVVHDWMGLGDQARETAVKLTALGYTALAADVYGKGVRPRDTQEAGTQATLYKSDRELMRRRIVAAFEYLKAQPGVDPDRIAVIGYCFGGTVALELARSGAGVKSAVSFHGGLDAPTPSAVNPMKTRILALHGAEDPYVPQAEVEGFVGEMRSLGADWQLVVYSGAVHAFTNPLAGNDPSKGVAYDAKAAARSWEAMKDFLAETLAE